MEILRNKSVDEQILNRAEQILSNVCLSWKEIEEKRVLREVKII